MHSRQRQTNRSFSARKLRSSEPDKDSGERPARVAAVAHDDPRLPAPSGMIRPFTRQTRSSKNNTRRKEVEPYCSTANYGLRIEPQEPLAEEFTHAVGYASFYNPLADDIVLVASDRRMFLRSFQLLVGGIVPHHSAPNGSLAFRLGSGRSKRLTGINTAAAPFPCAASWGEDRRVTRRLNTFNGLCRRLNAREGEQCRFPLRDRKRVTGKCGLGWPFAQNERLRRRKRPCVQTCEAARRHFHDVSSSEWSLCSRHMHRNRRQLSSSKLHPAPPSLFTSLPPPCSLSALIRSCTDCFLLSEVSQADRTDECDAHLRFPSAVQSLIGAGVRCSSETLIGKAPMP